MAPIIESCEALELVHAAILSATTGRAVDMPVDVGASDRAVSRYLQPNNSLDTQEFQPGQ